MTEPVIPPTRPDGAAASTEPRPRVGAGDVEAGARPGEEQFWNGEPDSVSAPDEKQIHSRIRTLIEWVAVAVGALAVALLIKAFLLQAFYIPSESMHPTLNRDDRVLVNKLSYRLGDVERGDVVVFPRPDGAPDQGIDDYIKRVIALPGETISFSEGTVFIDGRALSEDYVDGATTVSDQLILGCDNATPAADTCQVPADAVFVLGDNRGSSFDSRYFGPIVEDTIVGRAFLKVWPLGDIGFL